MIRAKHMLTGLAVATTCLLAGGPVIAADWPHDPPGEYMSAPPGEWEHREDWRRMSEERRHEAWAEHRRASWRCDHGDRDACHWLHAHG